VNRATARDNGRSRHPYGVTRFHLQFDLQDVAAYAARYPSGDDGEALAIGRAGRERGYYTLTEFKALCRWKTARSGPLVARNDARAVRRATRVALGGGASETERMRALRELHGVNWATASVLLHLAFPERYPILDVRVMHALGIRGRTCYGYAFWVEYVDVYRELLARAGVDGRTLDRGLWQWSAEHDVSAS
jgi:hypothetical protein